MRLSARPLHPWALSGATRTGLKESPGLLDDLRNRVAELRHPRERRSLSQPRRRFAITTRWIWFVPS